MRASHLAILVACGAVLLMDARCDGRREGALSQQIAAREATIAALATRSSQVDTIWTRDTVRLTVTRRVTDSLLRTDTLIHTDTFRIWLAGERAACDSAIATCVTRVAQRDSIIAHMDTLLHLERERHGCRMLWGLLACPRVSAGLNVDTEGARPGLHIGMPLP